VAAQRRAPRGARPSGQHFLRSPRLAEELVEQAGIDPNDLVVDLGAGSGRLTAPLARRARQVIAVELDPVLAECLRATFRGVRRVSVIEADAGTVELPREPFRVLANLPFAGSGAILERLADPLGALERAHVIVELGAARKRTRLRPASMRSLAWAPWWRGTLERELPAAAFAPPPRVDAALLLLERRVPPLLPLAERDAYLALLRTAFARPQLPLRRSLAGPLGPQALKRLARERGLSGDARPWQLQAADWAALYRLAARPRSASTSLSDSSSTSSASAISPSSITSGGASSTASMCSSPTGVGHG
jgi:23S rRNA (adenine-N6)-dimethyltransferase